MRDVVAAVQEYGAAIDSAEFVKGHSTDNYTKLTVGNDLVLTNVCCGA
jgi:hypothetical protein